MKISSLISFIILFVLGGSARFGALNHQPRLISELKNNNPTDNLNLYFPLVFRKHILCSPDTIESPFSIMIAALNQITPTAKYLPSNNLVGPNMSKSQYDTWYNQAFPTLISALKESGAGWTRIVIRWLDIEPNAPVPGQPPAYDLNWLQWYDNRLLQITQTGVKMIAIINAAPAWASNNTFCPPVTSDHQQEYQRFLNDLVTRYNQSPYNIKVWEIFNEADNTTIEGAGSAGCFGLSAAAYAQILSISYQTIKTIDPNSTVLMSGIAYDWFTEYNGPFNRYFPDSVMPGSSSYLDALNFHYFPDFHAEWERWNPPALPPTCGDVEDGQGLSYDGSGVDIIAKKNHYTNRMSVCYGINKPIWLTETGAHGFPLDPPSLTKQAQYVVQVYTRGLAAGIQNITWYALVSPPRDPNEQGLLYSNDFSPKPSFYAYRNMVAELKNFKYIRAINLTGGEAYLFKNNCQDEKTVAWGNNVPLTITPANELKVVDYLGSLSFIQDGSTGDLDKRRNGSIKIMLEAEPVFISAITQ